MVAEMVVPGDRIEVGDAVGVADDEGDRHGLAQRAAERQHAAADDADPGIGKDHAG